MPKCIGQHRTIKIGASYWPISAICRSSSMKFCDFLRICFIWFLLIGNECFWVFLLYLFQQVHEVAEKNITHNSSPFWQGSPFRQENSKKIEMSWNIQGIRIVFFKRLRFAAFIGVLVSPSVPSLRLPQGAPGTSVRAAGEAHPMFDLLGKIWKSTSRQSKT